MIAWSLQNTQLLRYREALSVDRARITLGQIHSFNKRIRSSGVERGNVSSLRRRRRRIEQSKKCARRREQTRMGRRRCRPHPSPVRFRVNLGQANCRHIFVYQGLVGDVDSVVALLALLYEV